MAYTIPPKQKALFLAGPKGHFVVQERHVPEPGSGEVLVEVHATALNPVDWKVHADAPPFITEYPLVLGSDAAGIVKKVGEGVLNIAVGDRV